ncbi:MAG: HEAT repeat domain-containing protein [bacterium]|nr:HEAT repeat domain-containing protein [bacterium]
MALMMFALAGCSGLGDAKSALSAGDKDKAFEIAQGFLKDGNPEVRIEAAQVVGMTGGERAAKALYPLLDDEEPTVGAAAGAAIGDTGFIPAGLVLTQKTPKARGETFEGIATGFGKLGSEAMRPLVVAFDATKVEGDWKAYRAMMLQIGPSVATAITESFKRSTAQENQEKFKILVELRSPKVARFLIDQIGDEEVAVMIVKGLVELGSIAVDPAVDKLKEYQGDETKIVQKALLCDALGDIKSKKAIPILEQMAKEPSDRVRAAADHALTKVRGF